NARRVLTVIHAAMVVVALFAILVTTPPRDSVTTTPENDLASIFSTDTSASMVQMSTGSQALAEEQANTQAASSEAQWRLDQFMNAWSGKDYASMVAYSSPNWVNGFQNQREAETGIFHLTAIRTPLDYQVTDVSGTDSDQIRTINMQATISKNDGREPLKYNFQILMIRSNGEWYVDPNSISSSQVVQQPTAQAVSGGQTQVVVSPTAAPLASSQGVRSDTVLFYNQNGGQYYHIDPNCSSIAAKYKPLTAMFYYRDVSSDTFKNLIACTTCSAPAR
ncbi:MAG TPA: hypothetical protein VLA21_10365, partial [Candidatus Limnocylindria bacterium]|nr:hypothetical protein [Candidatus Limnocylindria bacterium]